MIVDIVIGTGMAMEIGHAGILSLDVLYIEKLKLKRRRMKTSIKYLE